MYVGICTDKVSSNTRVHHPTFYINAHSTDGSAWTLQTNMVVAKAEENVVGSTKYHWGKQVDKTNPSFLMVGRFGVAFFG